MNRDGISQSHGLLGMNNAVPANAHHGAHLEGADPGDGDTCDSHEIQLRVHPCNTKLLPCNNTRLQALRMQHTLY